MGRHSANANTGSQRFNVDSAVWSARLALLECSDDNRYQVFYRLVDQCNELRKTAKVSQEDFVAYCARVTRIKLMLDNNLLSDLSFEQQCQYIVTQTNSLFDSLELSFPADAKFYSQGTPSAIEKDEIQEDVLTLYYDWIEDSANALSHFNEFIHALKNRDEFNSLSYPQLESVLTKFIPHDILAPLFNDWVRWRRTSALQVAEPDQRLNETLSRLSIDELLIQFESLHRTLPLQDVLARLQSFAKTYKAKWQDLCEAYKKQLSTAWGDNADIIELNKLVSIMRFKPSSTDSDTTTAEQTFLKVAAGIYKRAPHCSTAKLFKEKLRQLTADILSEAALKEKISALTTAIQGQDANATQTQLTDLLLRLNQVVAKLAEHGITPENTHLADVLYSEPLIKTLYYLVRTQSQDPKGDDRLLTLRNDFHISMNTLELRWYRLTPAQPQPKSQTFIEQFPPVVRLTIARILQAPSALALQEIVKTSASLQIGSDAQSRPDREKAIVVCLLQQLPLEEVERLLFKPDGVFAGFYTVNEQTHLRNTFYDCATQMKAKETDGVRAETSAQLRDATRTPKDLSYVRVADRLRPIYLRELKPNANPVGKETLSDNVVSADDAYERVMLIRKVILTTTWDVTRFWGLGGKQAKGLVDDENKVNIVSTNQQRMLTAIDKVLKGLQMEYNALSNKQNKSEPEWMAHKIPSPFPTLLKRICDIANEAKDQHGFWTKRLRKGGTQQFYTNVSQLEPCFFAQAKVDNSSHTRLWSSPAFVS